MPCWPWLVAWLAASLSGCLPACQPGCLVVAYIKVIKSTPSSTPFGYGRSVDGQPQNAFLISGNLDSRLEGQFKLSHSRYSFHSSLSDHSVAIACRSKCCFRYLICHSANTTQHNTATATEPQSNLSMLATGCLRCTILATDPERTRESRHYVRRLSCRRVKFPLPVHCSAVRPGIDLQLISIHGNPLQGLSARVACLIIGNFGAARVIAMCIWCRGSFV